jgi:hypothetical protein
MSDECHAVRRKFLDLTKRHAKLKETLRKETVQPKVELEPAAMVQEIAIIAAVTPPNKPKFVGGGFSINIPTVS